MGNLPTILSQSLLHVSRLYARAPKGDLLKPQIEVNFHLVDKV